MITLTFDDALLNTFEVAFPLLQSIGVRGVLFIPTGLFTGDCPKFRKDDEKFMQLDQVKRMHAAGWEIGSHSVTHPRFDQISDSQINNELVESKKFITGHFESPISFAYPFGHYLYNKNIISESLKFYRFVRTVSNPSTGFINSFPIDSYPPMTKEEPWNVYTIHAVKDPEGFSRWLKSITRSIKTFKEIINGRM
jgi:peptidoglycan/xylan/chitin deacetylase (PgdA/CDA1 family)